MEQSVEVQQIVGRGPRGWTRLRNEGPEPEPEPDEENPEEQRAEREVAEAEELLRQWEASRHDEAPFDLIVQSMIGNARVTLKGVRSSMRVAELQDLVHTKMTSNPTPLMQRLFIVDGNQRPLEDETLPIGAYGVVAGVTLHLAMRDEEAARLRMQLRQEARARSCAGRASEGCAASRQLCSQGCVAAGRSCASCARRFGPGICVCGACAAAGCCCAGCLGHGPCSGAGAVICPTPDWGYGPNGPDFCTAADLCLGDCCNGWCAQDDGARCLALSSAGCCCASFCYEDDT